MWFCRCNSVVTDKEFFYRFYLVGKTKHSYDITGKDFRVAVRYENSAIPEN